MSDKIHCALYSKDKVFLGQLQSHQAYIGSELQAPHLHWGAFSDIKEGDSKGFQSAKKEGSAIVLRAKHKGGLEIGYDILRIDTQELYAKMWIDDSNKAS